MQQSWLHPSFVSSFIAAHEKELQTKCSSIPCVRMHQALHAMQLLQWQSVWHESDKHKLDRVPAIDSISDEHTPTDDCHVANILIDLAEQVTARERLPRAKKDVASQTVTTEESAGYADAETFFKLEL